MKNWLRRRFINYLTRHTFNVVTEEDLLNIVNTRLVYYKGKQLDVERIEQLKKDAELFANSTLWHCLRGELQYQAIAKSLHKSSDINDVIAGKLMLYIVDVVNNKLQKMRKM